VIAEPERVARALRHPVRRAALAVVLAREAPVPVQALVRSVTEQGEAFGVEPAERGSLREALAHRHLPVLVLADLLSRRGAGATVAPGDHRLLGHPVCDPAWLRRDATDWEALGAVYGQPHRRVAVRILAGADLPVDLSTLARAVAAERGGGIAADAPVVEELATRLHHVGLPMLAAADVVTYDATHRRVQAAAAPDLPLPVEGFCTTAPR
jgi:hypothetical protein